VSLIIIIGKIMSKPLISVVMPVYNVEKYISKAVNSVLEQTFKDFEFIIVDASDDRTSEKITSIKDERIKYFKLNTKGISIQLNYALGKSSGKYIARMDADDYCHQFRLEEQLKFLENNKNIDLVGTNFSYISEDGKVLRKKKLPETHNEIEYWMPVLSTILHSTIMTKKGIIEGIGGYNEELKRAEDIDLFYKLFINGFKVFNLQKNLYYYRTYSNSKKIEETKAVYNELSLNYIITKYDNVNSKDIWNRFFLLGAHEYYNGTMESSKRYLIKAYKKKCFSVRILRFLIPVLIFKNNIFLLRNNRFLMKIIIFIKHYTGFNSKGI